MTIGVRSTAAGVKPTLSKQCEHYDTLLKEGNAAQHYPEMSKFMKPGQAEYDDAQLLCRYARVCHAHSDTNADDRKFQEKYLREGIAAAERAVELEPELGIAHKWLCILLGLLHSFLGHKDAIANGHRVKKHADIAAKKLPDDCHVYQVLAGFCIGVCKLNWFERTAAAVFFGEPPTSTWEEALAYQLKCCELMEKAGCLNVKACADLGDCYQEFKDDANTKIWWKKCLEVKKNVTEVDRRLQQKVQEKLERL